MSDPDPQDPTSARLGGGGRGAFDLHAEITRRIAEMLDRGVVPWRSPILGQAKAGYPKNLESLRPYRGVNVFLLAFTAYAKGYESAYWLTFNQARAKRASVRKGEQSSIVVFWKRYEVEDKQMQEKKQVPLLRYYRVFNVEQCDGIEPPDAARYVPTPFEAVAAADAIVRGYADGPRIEHGGSRAYYRPSVDAVRVPEPTRFASADEYYSTLFHELSHSTGIKSRLDRGLDTDPKPFGSADYGKEELVAELSAAFLCGHAGITPAVIPNQAAYIAGWLGRLREDKKLITLAAGAAQRSADWIRGERLPPTVLGDHHEPDAGGGRRSRAAVPAVAGANAPAATVEELQRAAREYIAKGFAPVPVLAGHKSPVQRDWQHLRVATEGVAEIFRDKGNIGILLGRPSGDLVDVDLDCPEARELADHYLPPTGAVTGRPGSPRSHRWYRCPGVRTKRYRDPVTRASVVEVRGEGCQTLVGPSVHPSGEPYDRLGGEPAVVDADTLCAAVAALAGAVIGTRHPALSSAGPAPVPARSRTPPVDRATLLRRAAAYLGAMPAAVSGAGGHDRTFAAATALVHGFGLSEGEAMELLAGEYNPRCEPPWSERELEHKVRDAATRPHVRPFGWLAGADVS